MHEVHFFFATNGRTLILHIFSKSTGTAKVSRYILNGVPSTGTELLLGASTEYRYRLTFKVPMPTFGSMSDGTGTQHVLYLITQNKSRLVNLAWGLQ